MPMFDRLDTEPVYNTRAVVQRTGVPADTFRAWERRYGAPAPCRTEGNQRLYSERDVAVVSWLRDQTKSGMTISQAVSLYNSICTREVANDDRGIEPAPPFDPREELRISFATYPPLFAEGAASDQRGRGSTTRSCLDLLDALTNYDAARAERIVEELAAFTSAEAICHDVLEPALVEIGRRWQHGALPMSAEHFASAFVLRKAHSLFNGSHPHIGHGPVLASCVEGEQHEIGLLFTSLFLSRSGYQVIYLGANLPADQIVSAARSVDAPLVLLSASTEEAIPALTRTIKALRQNPVNGIDKTSTPLIGYGGGVFNAQPELRQRIDALFIGTDSYQAVETCHDLLSERPLTRV